MNYFSIEPEVAGGWGENTVFERTPGKPTVVHKLHYEFDVWLGDPLLEAISCFIVTEPLQAKIIALNATGVSFGPVEISKSGQFEDHYPNKELPKFVWMQVTGKAGKDDFGLTSKLILVVSQRIHDVLKQEGMDHGDITEFTE